MSVTHVSTDMFCPYCLSQLIRSLTTDLIFCPRQMNLCDYEVIDQSKQPLSLDQKNEIIQAKVKRELKKILRSASDILGKDELETIYSSFDKESQ